MGRRLRQDMLILNQMKERKFWTGIKSMDLAMLDPHKKYDQLYKRGKMVSMGGGTAQSPVNMKTHEDVLEKIRADHKGHREAVQREIRDEERALFDKLSDVN